MSFGIEKAKEIKTEAVIQVEEETSNLYGNLFIFLIKIIIFLIKIIVN